MKRNLLTVAMLALAISMAATSCHKDDDNKPADNGKTENTTPTPDDKTPVAEKVKITLPDGSTKEVDKDSKYTVSAQTTTDDGLVVKYYLNGEEVSGKEITVSANTEITSKILATITFSDGTKAEAEKGTEYTLPAGENEYIIYKIGDEEYKNGDKISVVKNLEITIVAKYPELTMEELKSFDFSDKDEVTLRLTGVTNENVGEIKDYLKTKTNLILVGEVTTIDDSFKKCTSLQSIVIPDKVKTIERAAFLGCTSLESISIPNSVTTIGESAFMHCTSLESISIPYSVTTIGEATFENCTSLQSIVIPNSVKTIGMEAFSNCKSLQSVEIPNSVTTIGERAFATCKSLQSIEIPNSVTIIGKLAFFGCASLQSIVIKNSEENVTIGNDAFGDCPGTPKYQPESHCD